ncbi:MAG: hypothetical protein IIC67_08515 [Thaumarchaeota archaeon]|nr:hypothetical protein [Nitrososphaerota archaeon]
MDEKYRDYFLDFYKLLTKKITDIEKEYQNTESITEKERLFHEINTFERERRRIRKQLPEIQEDIWAVAWQKKKDAEKEKSVKEISLIFHYAGGNSIELYNVLFGKIDLDEKKHIHATERYLNSNVKISEKGGFIRDTVGAIQDSYVKLEFFELKENDIELVAQFLAEKLPLVKKEKLSLEINGTTVSFLEEEIKNQLQKSLSEI